MPIPISSSDYLEVAIGLVFVFLSLSLLASWIQEILAQTFSWRSKGLVSIIEIILDPTEKDEVKGSKGRQAVEALLSVIKLFLPASAMRQGLEKLKAAKVEIDGKEQDWKELTDAQKLKSSPMKALYDHGVVKGLAQPGKLPSYVAAQQFTTALLDLLSKAGGDSVTQITPHSLEHIEKGIDQLGDGYETTKQNLQTIVKNARQTGAEDPLKQLGKASEKIRTEYGSEILDFLLKAGGAEDTQVDIALGKIRDGIEALDDKNSAKEALLAIVGNAEASAEKAEAKVAEVRKGIETWYDATMERASGWYKRHTYPLALFIGIGLAVATNADTINIAQAMLNDPTLRDVVTAQAVAASQEEQAVTGAAAADLEETKAALEELGLPLGWSKENLPAPNFGGWFWKIVGLLITGFAISQGSSVWFGLLGRLVNMRGTGQKPKEAATNGG